MNIEALQKGGNVNDRHVEPADALLGTATDRARRGGARSDGEDCRRLGAGAGSYATGIAQASEIWRYSDSAKTAPRRRTLRLNVLTARDSILSRQVMVCVHDIFMGI